jgi:hypothetical protein
MERKIGLISFVVLLGALWTVSTWAEEAKEFVSPLDFSVKSWTEKFQGGGPGQPGNVLKALGQGFIFQHAELEEAVPDEYGYYTTTYLGGELTLDPSGPWAKLFKKGKLRATGIEAKNNSDFDPGTGWLWFQLMFEGEFDNEPGLYFCVLAEYDGTPEFKYDEFGTPVFQRGFPPEFWVKIKIQQDARPSCQKAW